MVLGVQLAAVCQSLLAGTFFQVALPAKLLLAVERTSVRMAAAEGSKARARERRGDWILLRFEVSNGGVGPGPLVEELFIDCIGFCCLRFAFCFGFSGVFVCAGSCA